LQSVPAVGWPAARQLDEVFWLEEKQVVREDWGVSYQTRWLQLQRPWGAGRNPMEFSVPYFT
jgi:hypothetical protein